MHVYQHTYKSLDEDRRRTGKRRKGLTWYIQFVDHLERRRHVAGLKDRKQTELIARKIEKLVRCRKSRDPLDSELTDWLDGCGPKMRSRLVRIGLLDERVIAASRPLLEHLDSDRGAPGFRQVLAARERTAAHVAKTCERVRRVIEDCRFIYWSDIDASRVEVYLDALRKGSLDARGRTRAPIGRQTSNYYLAAFNSFCRWMVEDRRAIENPIGHLKPLNAAKVRMDRRHVRRALTVEEIRRLLETARGEPERFGMTGPQRAVLYRLAIETGLRAGELASLTRASFDLDGAAPTVTVMAEYSKNGRKDVLPLRGETAAEVRGLLGLRFPGTGEAAFNMSTKNARMFRADLAAAREAWLRSGGPAVERAAREASSFLTYRDGLGRIADFHALRHTCGTLLAASGVHPKVAQTIMRHSTMELTMNYYTHVLEGQEAEAVAALPDLGLAAGRAAVATGTDQASPDGELEGRRKK